MMIPDHILSGPIAYLTGEYPRATDTFIQREVAALRGQGLDVVTCSIRKTGAEHLVGPEQREEAKNTFYVLSAAQSPLGLIRCHLQALLIRPGRYFRTLRLAFQTSPRGLKNTLYQLFYFGEAVILADHLQRKKAVHLHNHIAKSSCTVAMLTSEISGIPYSFTLHGPDIFFEPEHWRLDAKIARARFVACISEYCREQAMMFSKPDCWEKLHIVHCGVEPDRYAAALRAEQDAPHMTFVGRLAAVKGLPVLFQALAVLQVEFPDLQVTLIGDGPERAQLEDAALALGLDEMLTFSGYKSQSEVADALQETDLFVLPSFAEGVPVVLMEAMAARLAVVTTRIAGIPELVEDGVSGRLVPAGDVDCLADAIADLLKDQSLRLQMGRAGRKKVISDFNITTEAVWLGEIFRSYITGSQRPNLRPDRMKKGAKHG